VLAICSVVAGRWCVCKKRHRNSEYVCLLGQFPRDRNLHHDFVLVVVDPPKRRNILFLKQDGAKRCRRREPTDNFLSRKGVKTHKRGIPKNFERRRMERWGKTLPPMIDKPHRGHVGQIKDGYGGMTGCASRLSEIVATILGIRPTGNCRKSFLTTTYRKQLCHQLYQDRRTQKYPVNLVRFTT